MYTVDTHLSNSLGIIQMLFFIITVYRRDTHRTMNCEVHLSAVNSAIIKAHAFTISLGSALRNSFKEVLLS